MAPGSLCMFVLLETSRGCLEEVKPFALHDPAYCAEVHTAQVHTVHTAQGRMTAAAVNDDCLNDCQVARCQRLK